MSLDAHDFLNCLANVKCGNAWSELTSLDLGVIKEVLNDKSHELSWAVLDVTPVFQLSNDIFNFGFGLSTQQVGKLFFDHFSESVQQVPLLHVLGNYRVERVSQLVRDAGIDQG